jgi:hypothetical protein
MILSQTTDYAKHGFSLHITLNLVHVLPHNILQILPLTLLPNLIIPLRVSSVQKLLPIVIDKIRHGKVDALEIECSAKLFQ